MCTNTPQGVVLTVKLNRDFICPNTTASDDAAATSSADGEEFVVPFHQNKGALSSTTSSISPPLRWLSGGELDCVCTPNTTLGY